ncbi:hypothetical protein TNIN_362051 [Trichonephila inaurata madagascariensis]|uniref:Uncharacterized protein n=1 Tax=Trichonephila inaurata madagascariensis TaxID=2747483 RepID=A0A8X6XJK6_9ARAC|nr:hypothetical protein TNIN_362051 [Trichonephila inaurata madagascariensis]
MEASSSIVPQSATQKFNARASIPPTGKLRKPKREKSPRPSPGIRAKSEAPSSLAPRQNSYFSSFQSILGTGKSGFGIELMSDDILTEPPFVRILSTKVFVRTELLSKYVEVAIAWRGWEKIVIRVQFKIT